LKRKKVLFLIHLLPYPLNSGGKIADFKTLEYLSENHDVDLVCHAWSRQDWAHENMFRGMTRRFVMLDLKRKRVLPHFLLNNMRGRPHYIYRDVSAPMRRTVREMLRDNDYDLILADGYMSPYVLSPDFRGKRVLEKHNIDAEIVSRFGALQANPLKRALLSFESANLMRFELKSVAGVDRVITFTENDRESLVRQGGDGRKISVIHPFSLVDDLHPQETDPQSRDIVHIGTGHWPPNVDGLIWFAGEVFPKITRVVPEARLKIIGKEPPPEIRRLDDGKRVIVCGYVENLEDIYRQTGAFIVPLRIGSGIRLKILEALALCLPVATTSIGCEGIGVEHGRHVLIGDTAEDFARCATELLLDPPLRKRLGREGRDFILARFGWEKRVRLLEELILCDDN